VWYKGGKSPVGEKRSKEPGGGERGTLEKFWSPKVGISRKEAGTGSWERKVGRKGGKGYGVKVFDGRAVLTLQLPNSGKRSKKKQHNLD